MKKFFYFSLLIGVIGLTWLYSSYSTGLRYTKDPLSTNRVSIVIPEGSSAKAIGNILHKKELIKSPYIFEFYLKQKDIGSQLKAGRFVLQENNNLEEIVAHIIEGKTEEYAVTLLEGWTIKEIAQHLEAEELTTEENFLACIEFCEFDYDFLPEGNLEGYLYPDTYFVAAESYSDERFIGRLINTLNSKLSNEDWAAIEASDKSFHEIMTMASIVEREERNNSQLATVAGVLWNRFDDGIGLGADATVLYALGRTSGGLTYQDLQVDSPYNTRKYRGLPPTPIANPGINSIKAALYPNETSYYYYLHDPSGKIHYGTTLEEHNRNKAKYLR